MGTDPWGDRMKGLSNLSDRFDRVIVQEFEVTSDFHLQADTDTEEAASKWVGRRNHVLRVEKAMPKRRRRLSRPPQRDGQRGAVAAC